ncbi:S9 family peptidase [Sphingosinicella humi]|uniref:S9 family peptidase n=1 Tax=Allosphingosinicella humi TaxID=2068657 RepID=A0A2U2J4R7_9SPHN|nr:S9 family peptidase [Sphingosinicella humi]PWG03318.1 S9 family peptidase [Sphingosinicella humi]
MLKSLLAFGAVTLAAAPVQAQSVDSKATMFGQRESVQAIDISPDGTKVVYVAPGPGRQTVAYVASLDGGAPQPVMASDANPQNLSWCSFVTDDRLICRINALTDFYGTLVGQTRLLAIDTDGSDPKELGERRSEYDAYLRQFDGSILDWLPGEGGDVLMSREYIPEAGRIGTRLIRSKRGLAVERIDTRSLKRSVIEPAAEHAASYITDARGHVRIMETARAEGATGQLSPMIRYHYRPTGRSDWVEFSTYNVLTGEGAMPIAVEADLDAAYVLKKLNGRDALYRVKLDGSGTSELVYANDRVDVDNVVRAAHGQRVIGVTFAEELRQVVYFDEEYKTLAASLSKAIPNLPLIQFPGSSADGNRLLVYAGSDSDPGRYYVYDKAARTLNEIMLVRPQLENVKLADVRPVSYPAGDGVSIPAYLTLPPGKEGSKNLPAIVLPHGGPQARDEWGFDWLSQYLASLGYAVIQPNYRGSAGYGEEWLAKNGYQGWRTSIGDVTAAGKWLVSQGIADPKRLAILGWSYGGYAALQSSVIAPDLFKAVVAIAPVTDLGMLKTERKDYTNARINLDYIGSGPHIAEGSPLRNVASISAPVLMFHGDRDANVGIAQARAMDEALRAAGKPSRLVVYEGLAHSLVDSDARTDMLTKIGAFLSDNLASSERLAP